MLVEMFVMASMMRILKNSASSTSLMMSPTSQAVDIFSLSLLINCSFSCSTPFILDSRFCFFKSISSTSFSTITSDSSMSFVTTPLFAVHFARSHGRASASVSIILNWLRFTAPCWASCYELIMSVVNFFIISILPLQYVQIITICRKFVYSFIDQLKNLSLTK